MLALVCAAPVVASYVAYYWFRPPGQVNYGELLDAKPAQEIVGTLPGDGKFRLSDYRGRWLFLTVDAGPCEDACQRKLYATRQARTIQGREQERVVRMWLQATDAPALARQFLAEHPGLIVARVDPAQWAPGVYLELTDAEPVQLGRHGNLLGWYTPRREDGLFVFEFGPRQCPAGDFAVAGEAIAATRFYYDFSDGSSGTVAVVGLISDELVASITLTRNGKPDAQAVLGAGTFVIPAMIGLSETSSRTYLTARDAAGNVLERLPYRQDN